MKKLKSNTLKIVWGISIVIVLIILLVAFWPDLPTTLPPAAPIISKAYAMADDDVVWIGDEGVLNAPKKKGAGIEQQKLIDYAWFISGDRDFIYLIEAESGWRNVSSPPNSDGTRDHGYAQINDYWYKNIVTDPRFKDPYWQIERAYKLYIGGTPFYGKSRIAMAKNNFNESSQR